MSVKGFEFDGFEFGNDVNEKENTNSGYSQLSFADDWGMSLDSFFNTPEVTKKETKKKVELKNQSSKKETKKQKSSSNGKDEDVKLPVTVIARGFEKTLEGSGSCKLSEVSKKLIEEGYHQFEIPGMAFYYVDTLNLIFVVDGAVRGADDDTAVDLTEDKTITVIDGLLTATFSAEDFADKEEDEITAGDVAKRWAMVNPYYEGCKISYEEGLEYCYPVFDKYEYGKLSIPMQLMMKGCMEEYQQDEYTDLKVLRESLFGTLPPKLSISIAKTSQKGVYAIGFSSAASYHVVEAKATSSGGSKKVEVKYPLPLELYIVTFNCFYQLKPEHFEGKEKVTLEEIKGYMADKQKMFADKSRKLDVLYNEDMKRLAVMFVSGSKGCELIRTREEFELAKKKDNFHGFFIDKEGTHDVRALPHGTFITLQDKLEHGGGALSLRFERKLPKIPSDLLFEIIEYFKEDLDNESMVRVVYNKKEDVFSYYKADGARSKASISYEFDVDEDYFSPNMVQVMEIHSHNTMPPFFSSIDDEDESGYPGVFAVIGRLDRQTPSMCLRAGNLGVFTQIPINELFEVAIAGSTD